jgi:two-component system NtrC family sensor kinase
MTDPAAPTLLVVTGDYDILQRVRAILQEDGVSVQPGYSHLDALYLLNMQTFDGAFIDASVRDRRTDEATFAVLGRMAPELRCIVYAPANGASIDNTEVTDHQVLLSSLDDRALRRAYRQLFAPDSAVEGGETSLLQDAYDAPAGESWTAEEVHAFLTLSRSLTEVLDLTEVLNRVVTAARDLTGAEEGMILLPDGDSDQLYLRARVGIDSETARNFRVRTQDTLAGWVFSSGQPSLIGRSGPQKVKTEYFVKSLLYVPILLKGKPIGVLGVNNKTRDDTFQSRQQDLLMSLAAYAAIAIENARIHGQSIKRAREMKALVDAGEQLNQSLELDHALLATVQQMVRLVNVNDAMLFELDDGGATISLRARCRRLMWRSTRCPMIDPESRPLLRAALRSGSVRVLSASSGEEGALLAAQGAAEMMIIPIRSGERELGVLLAYATHARFSAQMTGPDRLRHVLQIVHEVVGELARGRERSAHQIARAAEDINAELDADWVELGLMQEGGLIALQASVGVSVWMDTPPLTLALESFPDLQNTLQMQAVMNVHRGDDHAPPSARALLDFAGTNMLLGLPLMQRGSPIGMIMFGDSEHDHYFSPREIDLARAIAGQAAAAVDNARLYYELQESLAELRATQNRLIQTERLSAMGELAAAVAHQINNPLTTILSDGQLLLERTPEASPEAESLAAIVRAGKRAKGVVRRLLGAVRTSDTTALELIDVPGTIDETVALLRSHIAKAGIRLSVVLPEGPVEAVRAVPGELDDVWLNLLLNAHDALAGRRGAEMGIALEAHPERRMLEISVWDNGIGIPPEYLESIFKPFFTTKAPGEGTGLGLHIARQAVEHAGGTLRVESAPDRGARFIIELPTVGKG